MYYQRSFEKFKHIDNNASESGIDEDEEYHDSLENIGTVIGSEGSFSEVPNDTISLDELQQPQQII